MSLAQEVSKQIKAAREAKGWTQEELAKRCGVRKAQVSKIERDISHASMGLFLKVCEVFDFNLQLLDEAGETWKKTILALGSMLETITEENVKKYITELGKPVEERTLPNVDIGKALDSVIRFTLTSLKIDYIYGSQDYDYRFNIGNKIILLSWKMGNLNNDDYINNCLREVERSFNETHAHEYIVTMPDYPQIAEEMNSKRYIEHLIFVPINSLDNHLKGMLESEKS